MDRLRALAIVVCGVSTVDHGALMQGVIIWSTKRRNHDEIHGIGQSE